jgi:hypothetical protein
MTYPFFPQARVRQNIASFLLLPESPCCSHLVLLSIESLVQWDLYL